MNTAPVLEVKNLTKRFAIEKGVFKMGGFVDAVQGVSFSIQSGEVVALVGESGSGKSTVGKMIQGLIEPASGEIFLNGEDTRKMSRKKRAHFVQMIFQDLYASLNPKLSVKTMLEEAISQGEKSKEKSQSGKIELKDLLESVGLPTNILKNYPHQFSGGQKQRLGIARALAMKPKLIIADEPVSALDVSVQAQILNLLMDLKDQMGMSYLLIAHDLAVVERIADRILVLNEGKIVEEGFVEDIFNHAKEPYSIKLLSAMSSLVIHGKTI